MEIIPNAQLKLAFDFLEYTDKNIFLTGKAGTGKTTFLHNLKKRTLKRMVVVAPTGVAAINAGGVTIHSFFQISFGPQVPEDHLSANKKDEAKIQQSGQEVRKFGRNKINILKTLDLLVIDEISMVRADLLDAIDGVLRRYKNRNKPFGGVQLLMIGDLQQLAPVVKDNEWEMLRKYYDSAFFFGSRALQKTNYISIELKHIYRQKDDKFIEILNKIRDNKLDAGTLDELNKRYIPDFSSKADDGYIILTTHNAQAQKINETRLDKISAEPFTFTATIEGDFPEYSFPTDPELELKTGAQVMFVKNDPSQEKLYYNGKIGKITSIDEDMIYVNCPGESYPILVQPVEWTNVRYSLNETTATIEESIAGKFSQYPLKLAWAITIHKSQGLTFEKAIIDANMAFAHGQVYVALSRCKTLEGMVLNSPLSGRGIISNNTVSQFNREIEQNQPGEELLNQSKKNYQKILLLELFDFKPIQQQLFYFIKILKEHAGTIQGSSYNEFEQTGNLFKAEVTDISQKFESQIQNLFQLEEKIDENNALQDRIQKASTYFLEKIKNNLQVKIVGLVIDSDNKTVRKQIKDVIDRLEEFIRIKISCLKECKDKFSVISYLEARAKSTITKSDTFEVKKKTSDFVSKTINHYQLYTLLKDWRNNLADESNLPQYMILPQKTMVELANSLPQSLIALKTIKGMGKKKVTIYGKEILDIIVKYCLSNKIEIQAKEIENLSIEKPKKPDTRESSFKLFVSGKSVEEIALERSLSVTTIEGHLAHYISTGKLTIEQFVNRDKFNLITTYFKESQNYLLTPAKQALGDYVSYSELRFVLKHLEYTDNLKVN